MKLAIAICGLFAFLYPAVAQENNKIMGEIMPAGTTLGMSFEKLKEIRPSIVEGPKGNSTDPGESKTFVEVINFGKPGYTSIWYFVTGDKVVGTMKTQSLIGIEKNAASDAASQLFSSFIHNLGKSSQEQI